MLNPTSGAPLDDGCYTLMIEGVSFGGTLA
jgi:hypothetical protein